MSDSVFCAKCGKQLPTGSRFCGFCGAPLAAAAPAPASVPKPPDIVPESSEVDRPSDVETKSRLVLGQALPPQPPSAPAPEPRTPAGASGDPTASTATFVGLLTAQIVASVTEVKPDGSSGRTVEVGAAITIGREGCDLDYPQDPLLAARHATLQVREGRLYLKDLQTHTGTYLKQRQDFELATDDVFLVGRDLFRFTLVSLENPQNQASPGGTVVMMGAPKLQRGPMTARLEHIELDGTVIEEFSLDKAETTIGRTRGDLIFKNDPYMSSLHARVVAQPGRFIVQDLKSKNGVYLRARSETELKHGDEFFLGEQLFRVQIKTGQQE